MVVNVIGGSIFDFSVPKKLCNIQSSNAVWDIAPDGQRFLVQVLQSQQVTLPRLDVVTEWFEAVKEKFATNKN